MRGNARGIGEATLVGSGSLPRTSTASHPDAERSNHQLQPLPTIPRTARTTRPRQWSNNAPPTSPPAAFLPLAPISSRPSLSSTSQTFVEAPGLVTALPSLARQETLTRAVSRRSRGSEVAGIEFEVGGGKKDDLGGDRDGDEAEKEGGRAAVAVLLNGQEIEYPDGGRQAWFAVIGGLCALFCGFGLTASLGGFQTYYRTSLLSGYSSTIAWITGTQGFISFFLTAFTGSLFDKYGHKPLIASGTLLCTFGFMMLSLCKAYWQLFICHAAIIGPGINLMFISPVGVVGQWFFAKRGMAFGLMMMGASVGAVAWPLIVANLPSRVGFGWTCRLMGFICLLLGVIAFFLLQTRLPPKPAGPFFLFSAFKGLAYCCLAAASFTYIFGFFTFLTFIGTYGQLIGLGSLAPYLLVILNASSAPGRIILGLSADVIGPYNVCAISVLIMALDYWCWMGTASTAGLVIVAVMFGFWSGALVSLQAPMTSFLATDMRFAGTMVGQVLFFQSFGQLIGPPVFGQLLGTGTAEQQLAAASKAIGLGAAMMTASATFLFIARFAIDRRILAKV